MLEEYEKLKVLSWRNHELIRTKMYNDEIISLEEHKNFLLNLPHRSDSSYWMAYYNDKAYGSAYFVDIDRELHSAELGYYISPEYMDKGGGLAYAIAINQLAIHIGLESLYGVVRKTNIPAMLMEEYMGGIKQGEKSLIIRGQEVIFNVYKRDTLQQAERTEYLRNMRNFIEFYKKRNNNII